MKSRERIEGRIKDLDSRSRVDKHGVSCSNHGMAEGKDGAGPSITHGPSQNLAEGP